MTNSIDKNAKAWIPSNLELAKIKWSNLTNETIESAKRFKTSWAEYVKALKGFRNQFINSLNLNITNNFICHGNLNFEIKIKVNMMFINVGVKVNGSLVGFQSEGLFYIDLLNLGEDRGSPGKYFGIELKFSVYMFTFKFWRYYEISDCDWVEKTFNFMMNSRKNSSRSLNYHEKVMNSEVKGYRNLGVSSFFSNVCNTLNNAITNEIKISTSDVVQVAKNVVLGEFDSIQNISKVVSDAFDVIKTFIMKIPDKIVFEEIFHLQELKKIYQDFGGEDVCGMLPGVKREEAYAIMSPIDVMYYQFNLTVRDWEDTYGMELEAFNDNAGKTNT